VLPLDIQQLCPIATHPLAAQRAAKHYKQTAEWIQNRRLAAETVLQGRPAKTPSQPERRRTFRPRVFLSKVLLHWTVLVPMSPVLHWTVLVPMSPVPISLQAQLASDCQLAITTSHDRQQL
jgi:hypothetical protein